MLVKTTKKKNTHRETVFGITLKNKLIIGELHQLQLLNTIECGRYY